VLRHDDFVLTQNAAILHYIAELYPAARLLGGNTLRERAETMRWLAFLNSDVHPAFKPLFAAKRPVGDSPAERVAQAARQRVRSYLERADQQLEGQDWIAGSRSVADPYLFVIFRWAIKLDVDLTGLGRLAAFAKRMHADPSVGTALYTEEEGVAA